MCYMIRDRKTIETVIINEVQKNRTKMYLKHTENKSNCFCF